MIFGAKESELIVSRIVWQMLLVETITLFLETVVNPDGWNYNIDVLVYGINGYKLYANI